MMEKSIRVLDVFLDRGATVVFTQEVEDEPDADPPGQLTLSRSDWVAFGHPREITIVIMPGDYLNDEELELVVNVEERYGAGAC